MFYTACAANFVARPVVFVTLSSLLAVQIRMYLGEASKALLN